MARIAAVLSVILRSAVRSARSVGGLLGNNFLLVIALLMAEEPVDRPSSTSIFYFVIGLLYAIPLANDLTLRIPAERFALWPLRRGERVLASVANMALNPLLAVAILFAALSRHPAVRVGLLASGLAAPFAAYALRFAARGLGGGARWSLLRLIPRFPGRLGGWTQNRLRAQLWMLDLYFAAALAVGGILYRRYAANPDPAADLVIGHLLLILLSTLAQANIAFDAGAEETRARLLPVSGAAILFAQDLAWLSIAAVLAAGYATVPVGAAALAALIAGHSGVGRPPAPQRRGHFATGTLWPVGIAQIFAILITGALAVRFGVVVLLAAVLVYVGSLAWYGRRR